MKVSLLFGERDLGCSLLSEGWAVWDVAHGVS